MVKKPHREEKTIITRLDDQLRSKYVANNTRGRLRLVKGNLEGALKLTFPINKEHFTIGRSSACHMVIDDRQASRIHAQVVNIGGKEVLEDLGSANGTFVNELRVTKRLLAPGDVIRIGTTELRYESVPESER